MQFPNFLNRANKKKFFFLFLCGNFGLEIVETTQQSTLSISVSFVFFKFFSLYRANFFLPRRLLFPSHSLFPLRQCYVFFCFSTFRSLADKTYARGGKYWCSVKFPMVQLSLHYVRCFPLRIRFFLPIF